MREKLLNIFKIYKADMKKVRTNWVAFIIIGGLACLPSLYAWVNIKASWDPYSNTNGVKVGIVNKDKGATLKGKDLNIGEGVAESLKDNKKLGWVFYENEDEGKAAVEKGKVYATIIIPEDFSHKLGTALDANPLKPKLEYYVNEKINAIAPKMTDAGASTIQKQISTTFVDTSVKKIFEAFNKMGVEINDYYPQIEKYKVKLFELNDNFPELSKKFDNIIEGANEGLVKLDSKNQDINDVQKVLTDTVDFLDEVNKSLGDANKNFANDSNQLKQSLTSVQNILTDVSRSTGDLYTSVNTNKPEVINKIDNAIADIDNLTKDLDKLANRIEKSGIDTSKSIDGTRKELLSSLKEDKELLTNLKNNIKTMQGDIAPMLKDMSETTEKIAKQTEALRDEVKNLIDQMNSSLDKMDNATAEVDKILDKALTAQNMKDVIIKAADLVGSAANAPGLPQSVKDQLEALQTSLIQLSESANYEELIKQIKALNDQIKEVSKSMRRVIDSQSAMIMTTLDGIVNTSRQISKTCKDLETIVNSSSEDAIRKIDSTIVRLDKASDEIDKTLSKLSQSTLEDSSNVAYDIRKIIPNLKDLRGKLVELKGKVSSRDDIERLLKDVNELTTNMATSTQNILIRLDGDILPSVERYLKNATLFVLDIRNVITSTTRDLDMLKDFLNRVNEKGQITVGELNDIKERLPKIQKTLNDVTDKIKEFEKTTNLQEIMNVFKNDADKEGNFFSQPVDLNTHKLFPMGSYGSAMTPFYSTLSLWVGALLLAALLSTKAKNVDFPFTLKQEFFGKYLLFGTFALIQGFIVCLGDIVVLGVRPEEPILFVFLGMFYSIVFTMIVFSLVSLFGNVGKAIAVVFMVVQLAGSGGTFPIEVTPKFFQVVYSLLPFTYAISGMREAIGGVVFSTLMKDLGVLILYFNVFMILGLTVKKWVHKILTHLNHKLGDSGLVDH